MEDQGRTDDRIKQAIAHAVCAGRLRAVAGERPDCARGLMRAADFHTDKAATLLGDYCGAGEPGAQPVARSARPHAR